jgi:tetratricopeptide (TPR) repeat protein/predicted Ser/Thr protein kinase
MSDEPTLEGSLTDGQSDTELGDASQSTRDNVEQLLDGEDGLARLGHYVLLQKLGQGGMGVVYAAYDQKLDRKVAIKLLRGRGTDHAQIRLVREAQAMAKLSHPNVVQIYEVDEITFIVMEFVDGVTLRMWLKQEPRSREAILAVFDEAGRGLAAAHAQGLVHRDFKPDNVMIRADRRALVMDFGLARAGTTTIPTDAQAQSITTESDLTTTGAILGTPAYMAPEQFRGDPTDARTDQFAFCVALWESLYQQRPFAGKSVFELTLAVSSGVLVQPKRGDVPAWLRKVIERGLASDANQRWPAMPELLDALQEDPTRRRRSIVAVGLAALVCVAALIGFRLQREQAQATLVAECEAEGRAIEEEWNETVRSELELAFSTTKLGLARSAWQRARDAVDEYTREWTELRTRVCVETDHQDQDAQVIDCLEDRRLRLASLLEVWAAATEPVVIRSTTAAANLPRIAECLDPSALAQRSRMPSDEHEREQARALRRRLEQVRGLHVAGAHEQGLLEAQALVTEAEQLDWGPAEAEAWLLLGDFHSAKAQLDEARADYRRAGLAALASNQDRMALVAASSLTFVVGYKLSKHDEGLAWAELGRALVERTGLQGTALEAKLINQVATIRLSQGDYPEALAGFERALSMQRAALGESPEVASMLTNLGNTLEKLGRYDESLAAHRESLNSLLALHGPDHPEIATSLLNLANVLFVQGQFDAALVEERRALATLEHAFGPSHPNIAAVLNNMGSHLVHMGDHAQATELLERALLIFETHYGAEHPNVAIALNNLADVQLARGRHAEALVAYQRALRIRETALGPDHPRLAFSLTGIGKAQLELGAIDEARGALVRALALREQAKPEEQAETRFALARVDWAEGDQTGSLELARQALDGFRAAGKAYEKQVTEVEQWLAAPGDRTK